MAPPWKRNRDPLFRGDTAGGVSRPSPQASESVVAHILYLGGAGRATPYHSTTESQDVASRFAGREGTICRTTVGEAEALEVRHIGQVELLRLLKGKGQGRAKWKSAFEVLQARRYVETWAEHLLDFSSIAVSEIPRTVDELYEP